MGKNYVFDGDHQPTEESLHRAFRESHDDSYTSNGKKFNRNIKAHMTSKGMGNGSKHRRNSHTGGETRHWENLPGTMRNYGNDKEGATGHTGWRDDRIGADGEVITGGFSRFFGQTVLGEEDSGQQRPMPGVPLPAPVIIIPAAKNGKPAAPINEKPAPARLWRAAAAPAPETPDFAFYLDYLHKRISGGWGDKSDVGKTIREALDQHPDNYLVMLNAGILCRKISHATKDKNFLDLGALCLMSAYEHGNRGLRFMNTYAAAMIDCGDLDEALTILSEANSADAQAITNSHHIGIWGQYFLRRADSLRDQEYAALKPRGMGIACLRQVMAMNGKDKIPDFLRLKQDLKQAEAAASTEIPWTRVSARIGQLAQTNKPERPDIAHRAHAMG